jgi:hypothetical protein
VPSRVGNQLQHGRDGEVRQLDAVEELGRPLIVAGAEAAVADGADGC